VAHADWLAHSQVCAGRDMCRPRRREESGIAGKVELLKDGILSGKVAAQRERYHMVGVESEARETKITICKKNMPIKGSNT